MALLKCPECTREISDLAESCPHCGFPVAKFMEQKRAEILEQGIIEAEIRVNSIQSNENEPYNNAINKLNPSSESKLDYKLMKRFVLFLIASFIVFTSYISYSAYKEAEAERQKETIQKRNWFNSAKTLIKSNKLLDNELASAKASLESVDASMTEYKEAQELLPVVINRISEAEAKEAKASRINKPVNEKSKEKELVGKSINERKNFAAWYEKDMINKGLDVYASAIGKNKTTFKVKFILAGRVLAYKYANNADFILTLRTYGFKKMVLTDGIGESWTLDL